jgi:hypothetical protein
VTPTQPIQGTEGRATAEETQRVRETECANRGHSYDVVTAAGRNAPVSVLCSNCGKSWAVEGTEGER